MTRLSFRSSVIRRTIYVENIKPDATETWLKVIFSEFGHVANVVLPRYRRDKHRLKGYAFVEYTEKQAVKKAVSYFKRLRCVIPRSINPAELFSIATFEHLAIKKEEKNDDIFGMCSKRSASASDADDESTPKKPRMEDEEESLEEQLKNYLRRLQMRILPKTFYVKLRNKFIENYKRKLAQERINEILSRPAHSILDEPGTAFVNAHPEENSKMECSGSQSKNTAEQELKESGSESELEEDGDSDSKDDDDSDSDLDVPKLEEMLVLDCPEEADNEKNPKFETEENHFELEIVPMVVEDDFKEKAEFEPEEKHTGYKGPAVESNDSHIEDKRESESPSQK